MEENKNKGLASLFNKWREVIESAETPFSKLAIFILPIITPLVPAVLTGMHIYQLLLEIFTFNGSKYLAVGLSFVVGIVLETLGYVGAISFIQNIFNWIRTREESYLVPSFLTFFSYLFYLVAMYQINVKLGEYFGTPKIMNNIVGLLAFITVPSSLLAATHLGQKEMLEREDTVRKESNEFKLKKHAIKHGINVFQQVTSTVQNDTVSEKKKRRASDYKEKIWKLLDEQRSRGIILGVKDITEHFDLPYDKAKGFVSTQRTYWAQERGVLLTKKGSTE